jgi:hypothetical protein
MYVTRNTTAIAFNSTQPKVVESNDNDEINSIIEELNSTDDYRITNDTISNSSRENHSRFNLFR